jgi:hypothetical protein
MLDILSEVGLDTNQFITIFVIAAIVVVLAYRPFVISILDPLNVFIIAMIANIILMFGLKWGASATTEFTFFIVFFWIGFALAGKIATESPAIRLDGESLLELEIVLVIATVIIVIANLYLGFTAGFPLFSADPSKAKVTTYTGGLGLIRHLDQGPYLFLSCGCTLLIAIGRKPMLALSMLFASSMFVALSGSKGALLPILFVQAFILSHKGLGQNKRYLNKIKKLALPSFGAAVAVAMAVVIHENGGLAGGLLFLGKRILFFGDVILFYYPRRGAIPALMNLGPFDYIHYLVDPLLGNFRILDYASIPPPLGTTISDSDLGFGPNAQYFVRADIFFGPVFGCFYCLAIGHLTNLFRRQFFTLRTRNAIVFALSLQLAVSALNIPFESSLFFSSIMDTLLFIGPLWCFARVATLSTAVSQPA